MTYFEASENSKGVSHLSVLSKSKQIKPYSALYIIFAMPGTVIETKLSIVRKEMSTNFPHIN